MIIDVHTHHASVPNDVEARTGLTSAVSGSIVTNASYTPWGAPSSMLIATGAGQVNATRTYDQSTLRLDTLTSTVGTTDILDYSYQWDNAGNLTRLADTGLGITGGTQYQCYSYDNLDRLTAAYTTSTPSGSGCGAANSFGPNPYSNTWAHDDTGNITTATGPGTVAGNYTYGAGNAGPHAATAAGTNTYSYDNVGNQTTRTVSGNPVQTLAYTEQNRLQTITENSTVVADYEHDADGTRTVVTNNGTTTYIIDEIYEITPGTPNIERISYRFGGQTIAYKDPSGLRAVAAGHLGSIEAEVTSTGSPTRQMYYTFGSLRSSTSNALGTNRTFTDQIDDGTGLNHYRARQYDPILSRFIQPDSLVLDGFNRYTYVRNNPTGLVDPSGLCGRQVFDQCITDDGNVHNLNTTRFRHWLSYGGYDAAIVAGFLEALQSGDSIDRSYVEDSRFGYPAEAGLALDLFDNGVESGMIILDPLSAGGTGYKWFTCNGACGSGQDPISSDLVGVDSGLWDLALGAAVGDYLSAQLRFYSIAPNPAPSGLADDVFRSADEILTPGGTRIGTAGSRASIREVSGGLDDAQALFTDLSRGGTVVTDTTYPGTLIRLPDGGGTVGIRTTMTKSPGTIATIDVNVPGIDITKIKFN